MKINNIKKYFNIDNIVQYGDFYKIKNNLDNNNKNSKLILVTSINPTPSGEGKTTTLIGINDCLNYFNKKSIAVLRQPSIGPFFGIKGGATGSGECSLQNHNKINCGLTGDFFKIETANNLIAACIENEIFQKSALNIDPKTILWNRCIDINDRSLRNINYEIDQNNHISTCFNITAASYLMATFCLAKSKKDFQQKVENTLIAFSYDKKPIYVKDLNIIDSIMLIMDEALNPNLCFSKYDNPVIVHGGPFANIAHGCNSIIATQTGLNCSDYVLTEAGFGIDLGAEKFLNIKMREMDATPNLVVIAVTVKSLKYHGGVDKNNLKELNLKAVENGFNNLVKNVESIQSFNLNFVIVINKFSDDNQQEIDLLKNMCDKHNYKCEVSTMWQDGPSKNKHIHDLIINNLQENKINYSYELNESVESKANKIAKIIYGANSAILSENVKSVINQNLDFINNYYVCVAKTFSSLSDDATKLNRPTNFDINVQDIQINHSAKFVILITSKTFLMPGLPKTPNAKVIKYNYE